MRNIYPQILPESLSELPDLLKGKVSCAAEMCLASRCDYEGALACEMAAHLLDEEMTTEETPYSFEERRAIMRNARQLYDWAALDKSVARDPVLREKALFVIVLAISYTKRDRNDYCRYMNEAADCARCLARIYREQLEAASSEDTCMAEGA